MVLQPAPSIPDETITHDSAGAMSCIRVDWKIRKGNVMKAIHLVGDLDRCNCTDSFLRSCDVLEHLLATECTAVGLSVIASTFHQSGTDAAPEGVTGAVLLDGSHVCVCTWADLRSVSLDVYVCSPDKDNSAVARDLFRRLVALFAPESADASVLHRGGKGTTTREASAIGTGD